MPQQQYSFGTTDVKAGRAEAAKLEGRTLKVPSPGQIKIRICPPWRSDLKLPFHAWTVHYGFRVEGFQPTHVCLRSLGHSYCPGCKAKQKLYDLSKQKGDAAFEAASDVRESTRFLYNVIANVYSQPFNQNGQNVLVTDCSGEPRIQVWSANDQVHQNLWRSMADWNVTDPFKGFDIELHRQPTGQQKAEYAPTQLYISHDSSIVSERILNCMNAGMPELDKFYEVTDEKLFEQIASAYLENTLQKLAIPTPGQVAMGGYGPAAVPPGVPTPPAPSFGPPISLNPPGMSTSAPPPSGYTAQPPRVSPPASAPVVQANENPWKALVPATDLRIVQGHKVPDCFGRYGGPDDRDCQSCAFSTEECCPNVTSQLAAGKTPTMAPPTPPASSAAAPAQAASAAPVRQPARTPSVPLHQVAPPATVQTPGGPAVNAAALENLEASLSGGQPQK